MHGTPTTDAGPGSASRDDVPELDARATDLDETRRLELLRTIVPAEAADPELDALAELAAAAANARFGAVELVGRDWAWVKGAHGLAPGATPRASSIADEVVRHRAPLLASDASADPELAHCALVRGEPSLRFVAAVPIFEDGFAVGALWVGDRRPRGLSTFRLAPLETAARNVVRVLRERHRSIDGPERGVEPFRDRLLAALSHDLRNPLSAIACSVGVLPRLGDLTPAQDKSLQRIASSVKRLEERVRDLIDFTRSRMGGDIPIERHATDVADLGAHVVAAARLAHGSRELHLDSFEAGEAFWDAARIEQVLRSVLDNALSYSPPETPVTLAIHGDRESVSLAVHNHGAPIARAVLEHIFEPSQRPLDDAEQRGSLGLGLHIAREIVLAHGGTIEVASPPSGGTTVAVVLPRLARSGG